MIWRFGRPRDLSEAEEEQVERRATKLVAYTFFILGAYVLYESARRLYLLEIPSPSLFGIYYRYSLYSIDAALILLDISHREVT